MDDTCLACGFVSKRPKQYLREISVGVRGGHRGYATVTVCKAAQSCQQRIATKVFHHAMIRASPNEIQMIEQYRFWMGHNVRRMNAVH